MSNFEINFNDSSSGSGVEGYIAWTSKGTEDESVSAKNFYYRNSSGDKITIDEFKGDGVIMDIYNMKTGWQRFYPDGTVEWVWNDDLKNWKAKPSDEHKQGISIKCAIDNKVFIWSQSGVAVVEGFKTLAQELASIQIKGNKLPKVKIKSVRTEKFKVGSTNIPVLEVAGWEERPFVLELDEVDPPSDGESKKKAEF